MKKTLLSIALIFVLFLTACSSNSAYSGWKDIQKNSGYINGYVEVSDDSSPSIYYYSKPLIMSDNCYAVDFNFIAKYQLLVSVRYVWVQEEHDGKPETIYYEIAYKNPRNHDNIIKVYYTYNPQEKTMELFHSDYEMGNDVMQYFYEKYSSFKICKGSL